MTATAIPLTKIIYGDYTRDYCDNVYPGHKKGCPNCTTVRDNNPILSDILDLSAYNDRFINNYVHILEYKGEGPVIDMIVKPFNLAAHVEEMKLRPRKDGKQWTDAQARCVLYWQRHKVDNPLMKGAKILQWSRPWPTVIVKRPEAHGVCCFSTMRHHNLILEKNPQNMVYKMVMMGKPAENASEYPGCKKN